ncbi:hypothetical protein OSTOST_22512, partial [Ostertagia ostertagi]
TSKKDLIEYERRMVVLKYDGSILQSNLQGNSEWKLVSLTSKITLDTTYEEGDFQMLEFSVTLRRNSQFYSLAIVIPTCVCTFLCINGLFLPTETSGLNIEKIHSNDTLPADDYVFLREMASDSRLERMWARIFDRINAECDAPPQSSGIRTSLALL